MWLDSHEKQIKVGDIIRKSGAGWFQTRSHPTARVVAIDGNQATLEYTRTGSKTTWNTGLPPFKHWEIVSVAHRSIDWMDIWERKE